MFHFSKPEVLRVFPFPARCGAVLSAAFTAFFLTQTGPAAAGDVLLRATEGGTEIQGNLLAYDGRMFEVATSSGVMQVAAANVTCSGLNCPQDRRAERALASRHPLRVVSGSKGMTDLVGGLVFAMSEAQDFAAVQEMVGAEKMRFLLAPEKAGKDETIVLSPEGADPGLALMEASRAEMMVGASAGGLLKDGVDTTLLARDAVVAVAAPGAPIRAIGEADLGRLVRGELTSWRDLGGRSERLLAVLPSDDPVLETVLASRFGALPESSDVMRMPADEISDFVRGMPNAIGITRYSLRRSAQPLPVTNSCGMEMPASDFAIRAETYPLPLPVYLYRRSGGVPITGAALDHADELQSFSMSTEGRDVIRARGLVDTGLKVQSAADLSAFALTALERANSTRELHAVKWLFHRLDGAERLSTFVQFGTGSHRISKTGQARLANLPLDMVSLLEGRAELMIVGYAEGGEGGAELALQRAEAVRGQMVDLGLPKLFPGRLTALGFAGIAPVGCPETARGQALNRRVELWIRQL